MKLLQRIVAPLIFWANLLKTKVRGLKRPRTKEITVPAELLPLLQVGTLALKYCEYAEKRPEDLVLNQKLHDLVQHNQADQDTMLFVEKVLFGKDLFSTVFTWLVFLGDAQEYDREPFRVFLTLPHQKQQK